MIISKTSIISKSNRAANARKFQFRKFGISKCFRSTPLCLPRAGSRAPEYAVPTSRLLQDPTLAHRQVIPNSGKRRGTRQREFCGGGTFTAIRIHTALVGFRNTDRPASLGPEIEHPSTRHQPLDYSRILPWLIVRPCPTLGSAVAHGSESFVGVVHSRRYVYIQPWWYSRRVHARMAALLAVRTDHTAVVVMVQQYLVRS